MKIKKQSQVIECIKMAFRLSRVWKQNSPLSKEYNKGWNDCIKQQKQNEKQYIEHLESMWKNIQKDIKEGKII
jgi:hypothetical protein